MGCFGEESERTQKRRAKQRAKAARKAQQMQPWRDERGQNVLDKRTRTHPATTALPFVTPEQMRPRTEAQNTYYVTKQHTYRVGEEVRHRHITKAEVLQGITQGPRPGQRAAPEAAYPKIYQNIEKVFEPKPDNYYHEYPVHGSGESKHTRGSQYDFTHDDGRKTGSWRGITNHRQQLEGVLVHNDWNHAYPYRFHKPDTYYIGPSGSGQHIQSTLPARPKRTKTQASGSEIPFSTE